MANRLLDKIRHTIRYKLLVLVLFPILLVMPVALGLAVYWGASYSYDQLYIKVNTDLSVSHNVFERIQQDYLEALARTAESYVFRTALNQNDQPAIEQQLALLQQQYDYSYLHLIDSAGKIVYRQPGATIVARNRDSSALDKAWHGQASSGIEIFSASELQQEGLADRVRLPLKDTPKARPSDRTLEDRGMMIRSLYPLIGAHNEVLGILDAGLLLNGNFEFVDVIRDLVYGPGSLIEGSIGTVTVFLDDVRITTNVPVRPGERALGTRVSNEVRTQVLDEGQTWIDRAFVVNDWYISSYEPILDVDGRRVGMLYAGFLEAPFRQSLYQALWGLVFIFLVLMALSGLVAFHGAKSIFRPLERISSVVRATGEGEEKRIGTLDSQDEIGDLAREFDLMLDLLAERKQLIENWAAALEEKVDERTSELQRKNQDLTNTIRVLHETRQQLVIAEKLAALGELTAGVAHEINNPTAVMLGNLDIIVDEMGRALDPVRDEVDLVIEQIYRIKDITNNLLQYARPDAYAGYIQHTDVNTMLHETLKLVQHLRSRREYAVQLSLKATHPIEINPQELRQVLVNLVGNAIQALPDIGGRINIETRDLEQLAVEIVIRDNGHGMDEQALSKVFNPFYTTKTQGEGTGLGLSISYSLVRRYGGSIKVDSSPGEGATFTVTLLSKAVMMEDEKMIIEQLEEIEAASVD
jgi:two-component system NtrC family sensor kinase